MSRKTRTRFVVLALVAALVVATGPAMAALTYDSETTNSASTSDLTGGETVTKLDNSSTYKTIQFSSTNATSSSLTNPEEAFTLKLTVNDTESEDDGRVFYTNTSTPKVVDATNGTYAYNVSHAELFDELERDVDEVVTVDVTVVFNESESDEEAATIQISAQNGDKRAVEVVTDDDLANATVVETTNESRTLWPDLNFATLETDTVITNNTTISYVLANETVADTFETAYDFSSFDSSDYIYTMTSTVEGTPIMVFASSAGEEREAGWFAGGFDPSEDTYAVYMNDGGDYGSNSQINVVPQGEHDEKASLEVTVSGNKKPGFWTAYKNFGRQAARAAGFGVAPEGLSTTI